MFDEAAACRRVFEAVPRQIDLARKLGLTSSAISNLKKRQKCTLELVIAASELSDRSIEWLLFGERRARPDDLQERARALAEAAAEASKRTAALAEKVIVAEEQAGWPGGEDLRALLRLYEERQAALESRVRALEHHIAALGKAPAEPAPD